MGQSVYRCLWSLSMSKPLSVAWTHQVHTLSHPPSPPCTTRTRAHIHALHTYFAGDRGPPRDAGVGAQLLHGQCPHLDAVHGAGCGSPLHGTLCKVSKSKVLVHRSPACWMTMGWKSWHHMREVIPRCFVTVCTQSEASTTLLSGCPLLSDCV